MFGIVCGEGGCIVAVGLGMIIFSLSFSLSLIFVLSVHCCYTGVVNSSLLSPDGEAMNPLVVQNIMSLNYGKEC